MLHSNLFPRAYFSAYFSAYFTDLISPLVSVIVDRLDQGYGPSGNRVIYSVDAWVATPRLQPLYRLSPQITSSRSERVRAYPMTKLRFAGRKLIRSR